MADVVEFTRDEFCEYLTNQLIRDLRESGSFATAADFEAAVLFIRGADNVQVGLGDNATAEAV